MISIVLADDHTIVRKGFRLLLEHEPDISVLGEAADGREAVDMALRLKPDLVLMDIMMPELNGFQATQRLRLMDDSIRVLILSMYSSQDHIHQVVQSGASGYLLKACAPRDLLTAVKEVAGGRTFYTPSVSRIRGAAAGGGGEDEQGHRGEPLHQREDGGEAPAEADGQAGDPRRGGADPLRHRPWDHRHLVRGRGTTIRAAAVRKRRGSGGVRRGQSRSTRRSRGRGWNTARLRSL